MVENEARAREVAAYRQSVIDRKRTTTAPASFDTMFSALKEKQAVEFPLVIKGDVQGSVEAIVSAVNKISNDDIKARVLHAGVGGITESDVTLAKASGAPIIGFNVRANAKAREIAERDGVAMQYYDVIYDLTDAVKAAMAGELGPLIVENVVGRAEVREVFSAGKHGKAAGLLVTEGYHPQGAEGAHHPRRRHRLQRLDRLAAALQGRRRRGPRRPRMRRHLRRPLPTSRPATSSRPMRSRSASGRFDAKPAPWREGGRAGVGVTVKARLRADRRARTRSPLPYPSGNAGRERVMAGGSALPGTTRRAPLGLVRGAIMARQTETPEGRSVRLLRVGEQVRHALSRHIDARRRP